jgi:hypothetical protein
LLTCFLLLYTWPAKAQESWSSQVDLGGVPLTSEPTAVSGGPHRLDVFYRGPNNHLWTSWWNGEQWWSAPVDLGGVELTSAPTAVVKARNQVDVFYRGPNGHLWASRWPDTPGGVWWSAPVDLGGVALTSAPTAISRALNQIDVFYRGPNNHLWTSRWPDAPGSIWWSAPVDLGGVSLTSAPSAVTRTPNQITVFYRGPNNRLWASQWPDTPGGQWWGAPVDLGGVALTSGPGAVANARHEVDVFYAGQNQHLWTSWWPDIAGSPWWSGPVDLGGARLDAAPAAVAAARNQLDVFYRGPNGHLWTSWWPAEPWYDTQTRQPSPRPAPYDLVTRVFDPDNGLPLNPVLGSQAWTPAQLAEPALCGGGNPWQAPCTTQVTTIDNNRAKCPTGILGGHANWGPALYEGVVRWENHSYYLQDDDYSFALFRDDLAGMTKVDVGNQEYLHSEFNSDETINHFHTWYWDALHNAVDRDAGVGGVLSGIKPGPYTRTRALFDGKQAIIMGLYGLDCAHDCGAELHPVYAFAVHLKDDPNDDTWAIFVRNWGDEGYCSSGQEKVNPRSPLTFSFRLKRAGATGVSSIPAAASDRAGQNGTVVWGDSNRGGAGLSWSGPVLVPSEGATVTFRLPPPEENGRFNGMLHLRWTVDPNTATTIPYRQTFTSVPPSPATLPHVIREWEPEAAEAQTTRAIQRMSPAQRESLANYWAGSKPPSPTAIRLSPTTAASPEPPRVAHRVIPVPDETRRKREAYVNDILRRQ